MSVLFSGFLPLSSFALESACFTEYAPIVSNRVTEAYITTEHRDDLFFIQDGQMIPSHEKAYIVRNILPYHILSDIDLIGPSNTGALTDDLDTTEIEIDPLSAPT